MKPRVTMELKNDYQIDSRADLEKLSSEIFKSLDEEIKSIEDFSPSHREEIKSCGIKGRNVAKGELAYKVFKHCEEKSELRIKFLSAYYLIKPKQYNCYIKLNIDLSVKKGNLDKKIFDVLKTKFHSFRKGGTDSENLKNES